MTDHVDGTTRDAANGITPDERTAYDAIVAEFERLPPGRRARVIRRLQAMTEEERHAFVHDTLAQVDRGGTVDVRDLVKTL